ncbi:MAG TPA: hypothetical protein PLQ20_01020 [Candidatus Paceibacterota bacterium]|nr:hypothetical protein [Candidatus Paceibacterota bacterium]
MSKIPPRKRQLKDLRKPLLENWCKLFEEIDTEIKTFHYFQEDFQENLERTLEIEFEYWIMNNARILILLPGRFDLKYLVGCSSDEMFSYREVQADPLIHDQDPYPCSPRLKPWKDFYEEVTKLSNKFKKEIPKLP